MRFGIRDLLKLTAIVSVYAAGLSLLASEGLLGNFWQPILLPLFALGLFCFARSLASERLLGPASCVLRTADVDRWHLGCLGAFVALVVYSYASLNEFTPLFALIPTITQLTVELSSRVGLRQLGVSFGYDPLPHREYYFLFDEQTLRLHAIPRWGASPRKRLTARSVVVPTKRKKELLDYLAEHEEEGTSSTENQRG